MGYLEKSEKPVFLLKMAWTFFLGGITFFVPCGRRNYIGREDKYNADGFVCVCV